MKILWILIVGALGKYKDVLWRMRSIPLTTNNFTQVIPQNKHTFVLFYVNHPLCKSKADIVNKAGLDIRVYAPELEIYRVDGSYSPEIIQNLTAIEEYPSLAYYYPGEVNITDVFHGKWTKEAIYNWFAILLGLNVHNYTTPECNKERIELEGVLKFHNNTSKNLIENNAEVKKLINSFEKQRNYHNYWRGVIYNVVIGVIIGLMIGYIIELRNKHLH